MTYENNHRKFTCVLNGKRPIGQLMNALGHVTAGLAAADAGEAEYLEYKNTADGFTAKISTFPFIVLKAKNGSQLSKLRADATAAGLRTNVFIGAMIGRSAEEQLAQTLIAAGEQLDYWAVVIFGDAAAIDPLTRKFSVFTVSVPEGVAAAEI
jgi:hypothetical protein